MIDNLPNPLSGTLDEILSLGSTAEKSFNVFVGHNLGYRVFLFQIPMHEFFQLSEVANEQVCEGEMIAQRKLDQNHAAKLAIYILKGLVSSAIEFNKKSNRSGIPKLDDIYEKLGKQPYLSLQPIIVNIRDIGRNGGEVRGERIVSELDRSTAAFKIFLAQQNTLWVIDGQHRRMAMKIVFDFLDYIIKNHSYPKKQSIFPVDTIDLSQEELLAWQATYESARTFCTVSVEAHLGLTPKQERQLFHDLNNLGKKIDKNLALKFDESNPINRFIKDTLSDQIGVKLIEKEPKDWKDDEGGLTLKDAVAINAILFLNKTNIAGALSDDIKAKTEIAKKFWVAIHGIKDFGELHAKQNTIAAQPVVLKALAKLVYDFSFNARKPKGSEIYLENLFDSITDIDFTHSNPIWRYYELSDDQIKQNNLEGLREYLPSSDDSANRDIGSYQNGYMRFGAKHNDIYPILGDMIRWMLDLPNRHIK